jgi:hypothetical protein
VPCGQQDRVMSSLIDKTESRCQAPLPCAQLAVWESGPEAHDLLLLRIGSDVLQSVVHSEPYEKLRGYCHWHVQAA